jgi:serine/threonine-protein kinase
VIAAGAGYLLYERIQNQVNTNKPVSIQNVLLEQQAGAIQQLKAEGFKVTVQKRTSTSVPLGAVISQDPPQGTSAPKSSSVTIVVSTGKPKVPVPSVKGFTLTAAESTLQNVGLVANVHYEFSTAPANTVTAQAPPPQAPVVAGSKVRINISRGPQPIPVPNVVGKPYANAESALQGPGFNVTKTDVTSQLPVGEVVSEDPKGGSALPKGTTIALTVSSGPALKQVPDVTGDSPSDAEALLRTAGFSVITLQNVPVTDPTQDQVVQTQTPVGGMTEKPDTPVTLEVGQFTASTSTTTTTTPTTPSTSTSTTTGTTTTATTTTTPPPVTP